MSMKVFWILLDLICLRVIGVLLRGSILNRVRICVELIMVRKLCILVCAMPVIECRSCLYYRLLQLNRGTWLRRTVPTVIALL